MKLERVINALRRQSRVQPVRQDGEQGHTATYTETVVYFTFVFGATPISPHTFAQRLLAAELAETVSSPADGEVRMAPRYDSLVRLIHRAERIRELNRAVADAGPTAWFWKNPLLGVRLLVSTLTQFLKVRRAHGERAEAAEDPRDDDVEASMLRVVADINEAVAERQTLNAIQHTREQDMYQPGYLESEPYLRLTLRKTNFGLAGFSDEDTIADGQSGDVLLLVHRSGVLQMTIAVRMPEGLSTDQLIPRTMASGVLLSWTELAEPVVEAASRRIGADRREWPGEWLPDVQEGTRWRRFIHTDPASLVDLFHLYRDAIYEVSSVDVDGEWFCYPVVCIDRLGCCGSEVSWTTRHRNELSGILMRYRGYTSLRESARRKLPPDTSITEHKSVWHTSASTTLISWRGDSTGFDDHLWTLLLIENFLLQYWQLQALTGSLQLAGTEPTAKVARDLQRRLIFGLEEFYRSSLTYGTAQETVADLLQESGAENMLTMLGDRLGQLGSIDTAERAERAAARTNAAALAAFAAAVVFGLPAIDQTLKIANAIPEGSVAGRLAYPFRAIAESSVAGSFVGYLGLLAILMVAVILYALPKRHRRPKWIRLAGRPWPSGTIPVVRQPHIEDPTER